MILVDTSVLIEALRRSSPRLQQIFIDHGAAICGIIRVEVLHGARDEPHFRRLLASLAIFPQVQTPEAIWDVVGANVYELRKNGLTVPVSDAIIATIAIENNVELWTRDSDFTNIQAILPQLRLFIEPP